MKNWILYENGKLLRDSSHNSEEYCKDNNTKPVHYLDSCPPHRMYYFSNGESGIYCEQGAIIYSLNNKVEIVDKCKKKVNSIINAYSKVADVYADHFNHGMGEYVKSKSDYKEKLKRNGLIEVGNEKPMPQRHEKKQMLNDRDLKEAWDRGARFSSAEERELKKL